MTVVSVIQTYSKHLIRDKLYHYWINRYMDGWMDRWGAKRETEKPF